MPAPLKSSFSLIIPKSQSRSISTSCLDKIIDDVKPTGFHNLPKKVLFSIFIYFNENELRKVIMPVCYKWKEVSQLPELWQTIKFQGKKIPSNFMCQQLRSFIYLRNIHLIDIDDVTTIIRQICRCNKEIEDITIKFCRGDKLEDKLSENVLRNLGVCCKKLQKINLKGTLFSANLLFMELALLPHLRSINLSKNKYLTRKNLFDLLLNSKELQEFKLSHRSKNQILSDSDVQFLFSNIKTNLLSLSFDMTDLTDMSSKAILQCNKLQKLCLYNTTNLSTKAFSDIWRTLPELKYLKYHHSLFSTRDVVKYFNAENIILKNLLILNLSGSCQLIEEELNLITTHCIILETIILKSCKNLKSISCLFDNCKNLIVINIAFCIKLSEDNILKIPDEFANIDTIFMDVQRTNTAEKIKKKKIGLNVFIVMSEFNKLQRKI